MTACLALDGRRGPVRAGAGAARRLARGARGRRSWRCWARTARGRRRRCARSPAPCAAPARITFAGKPLRGGPEAVARAGIAHVPEGRGTFTELTVVENLRLGAYTRRERELRADIDRISRVVPVDPASARDQPAGTLSGGEQQMLAVARALMARPRLLMLDEPSLGLAPMIVREIFRIVRELNERDGLTVLVVEQDARIALDRPRRPPTCSRSGGSRSRGRASSCARTSRSAGATSGTRRTWPTSCSRWSRGSPPASIYASLALALVLIHRATGVINFAQGEMATFSTYIAWTLTANHGWNYWPAFAFTLLLSFVGGVAHPPGRDPAEREGLGAARRDRHDRPAARDQRPGRR